MTHNQVHEVPVVRVVPARRPLFGVWSALRRIGQMDEAGVIGALFVIGLVFSIFTEHFLQISNLFQILRQITLLGIMAVGMTFVMSAGDIDLSIGSVFNVSVISMALVLQSGLQWWIAVPIGLAIGTLCGLINGTLSILLRIPSIIITLATLSLYKGVSLLLSGGRAISMFDKENIFFEFGNAKLGPMPAMILVMLAVVIVGAVVHRRTVFGRHACAVGSNRKAASYSGIQVNAVRLRVLTLSGFLVALSATLGLAHLASADPGSGTGYEMDVIAGVIIGGTKFTGGKGTVIGSIVGVAIMGTMRNGLIMLGVSPYWQLVLTGAVIITAVALDYVLQRR
ncbi:MAG TPA: ABC transporter permease [Anaerolineales bacterium]|nr:ABC transporter permease [Anaerolineales bacterium]